MIINVLENCLKKWFGLCLFEIVIIDSVFHTLKFNFTLLLKSNILFEKEILSLHDEKLSILRNVKTVSVQYELFKFGIVALLWQSFEDFIIQT